MEKKTQVFIIGAGPAGISAALYALRAGCTVLVADSGASALKKAEKIDNYYGTGSISGVQLLQNGRAQAEGLGVSFEDGQVTGLSWDSEHFTASIGDDSVVCDAAVLATGVSRAAPPIKGLRELEGMGVSYCAVCDGFFYRGKHVGVLGSGEYAKSEAQHLSSMASVTVLTDGKPLGADFSGFEVIEKKLTSVNGDGRLSGVSFEDGADLALDGLFIAVGVAGSSDFARKLGATLLGRNIDTDENMATNVPGLFAAGDCTGGLMQVAKAVCDGALAGSAAAAFVKKRAAAK